MIFVAAEKGIDGTRFIIDSVGWDAENEYFNFDRSEGVAHEAGILYKPELLYSSVGPFGDLRAILEIPLPEKGYYSDPEILPSAIIAGVAVYAIQTNGSVKDGLSPSVLQLVKAEPIDLSSGLEKIEVSVRLRIQKGMTPYFAYTLILEDGTDRLLADKIKLPLTSPFVKGLK